MNNPRFNRESYWASLPPSECAQAVWDIVQGYRTHIKGSVFYERWKRGFRIVHGLTDSASGETSILGRRGSKGHRASVKSAVAAVDARHQMAILAPVIPALDAIPINTAYKTLTQVRESKRFFDYYVERKEFGKIFYRCGEYMQEFALGWIVTDWDIFGGPLLEGGVEQPVQVQFQEQPQRMHEGELKAKAYTPLDLIVDIHQDGHHDWFICRDKVNRYKLIEDYPGLKSQILNANSSANDDKWMMGDFRYDGPAREYDTDLIPIWTLHHRRGSPMENGRWLRILDAQTWLADGAYPYSDLKLKEMADTKVWNSAFADSTLHHAGGLQQALDRTLSAMATNVLALAHQFVWIPSDDFELQELSDGVSAITATPSPNSAPPQGITLLSSQEVAERFTEKCEALIHATLGVNSVIRGEPDENIKSGAYAGLVVQQGVQYNSPRQYSFTRCVEGVGNDMLEVLQKFANKPILGEIAGPNGQWRMKVFKPEDFSGIHRLVAKLGNPAENTPAFKKAKADQMLEAGLITSRQEYEAAIEMKTDELAVEADEASELLILLENETMLRQGEGGQLEPEMVVKPYQPPGPPPPVGPDGAPLQLPPEMLPPPPPPILVPPVLDTDDHVEHIKQHAALLSTPGARGNDNLVLIVGAHNAWHLDSMNSGNPQLAMVLGRPPPPAAVMAAQAGAAPGGAPGPNGVQQVRPPKQIAPKPEETPPARIGP